MSIERFFMQVAKTKLDVDLYQEIYNEAVKRERQSIEDKPSPPPTKKQPAEKVSDATAVVVGAVLQRVPVPANVIKEHVVEQIEERFDLQASPQDIAELKMVIKRGGAAVQLVRTQMHAVKQYDVSWRGIHLTVVYNESRDKIVTAFPKRKKKKTKRKPIRYMPETFEDELEDMLVARHGG